MNKPTINDRLKQFLDNQLLEKKQHIERLNRDRRVMELVKGSSIDYADMSTILEEFSPAEIDAWLDEKEAIK
jgi:hypothetical protein